VDGLNNTAVELLEMGCYKEGLAIIKDGANAMEQLLRRQRVGKSKKENGGHEGNKAGLIDNDGAKSLGRKVRRAEKRLEKATADVSQTQTAHSSNYRDSVEMVSLIAEDGLIPSFLLFGGKGTDKEDDDEIMKKADNSDRLRLTRIELAPEGITALSSSREGVELIVMLCNCALEYYLLSTTMQDSEGDARKLLDSANSVFDFAIETVTGRFSALLAVQDDDNKDNGSESNREAEEAMLLFAGVLLTYNLHLTLVETNGRDSPEAMDVGKKYRNMNDAIRRDRGAVVTKMKKQRKEGGAVDEVVTLKVNASAA